MTIDETVLWFNTQMEYNKSDSDSKNAFLCGVTSDIDGLRSAGSRLIVCYTKCNTHETARLLLTKLNDNGFEIENSVSGSEDIFVYMSRK